jgi:hypothetical protein
MKTEKQRENTPPAKSDRLSESVQQFPEEKQIPGMCLTAAIAR